MKRSELVYVAGCFLILAQITLAMQGSGTQEDPFQISTKADLEAVNDFPSAVYELTTNIDLLGYVYSEAIIPAFDGTFNGQNHTINNLTFIDDTCSDYIGLFGLLGENSSIVDLNIQGLYIENGGYICDGSYGDPDFSLYFGGICARNNGSITNCTVTGNIENADGFGQYFGGICGINTGSITKCSLNVDINGGQESQLFGGVCGYNSGTIMRCTNFGLITTEENSYDANFFGGICGSNMNVVECCASYGDVYAEGSQAGNFAGLCGFVGLTGILKESFATGDILGNWFGSNFGGLVGGCSGSISNCFATGSVTGNEYTFSFGGLCGSNTSGSIEYCYCTGQVTENDFDTGSFDYGAMVGTGSESGVISCYYIVNNGLDNGIGTPITNSQMKQSESFIDWGFDSYWSIDEGQGYPFLIDFELSDDGQQVDVFTFSGIQWNRINWNWNAGLWPNNVIVEEPYLTIRAHRGSGMGAQCNSTEDYGLGTYSVEMKTSPHTDSPEGTCNGFFFYWGQYDNDVYLEQEIDVEILSSQTNKVNFTVHYNGNNVSYVCPVDSPDTEYYWYQFYRTENEIWFYVDGILAIPESVSYNGVLMASVPPYAIVRNGDTLDIEDGVFPDVKVPDRPGKIIINNWTGNSWAGDTPSGSGLLDMIIREIDFIPIVNFDKCNIVEDEIIDTEDFSAMVSQWSNSNCYGENDWCSGADIDSSGTVDLSDFLYFARYWLLSSE